MGKRGPRPQPTTLKALRGTIRTPDRRRGPDALAPAGRLVAPKYFTAVMRKRWRQILRDAPLNVLRPIDSAILTDFVVNEALAEQALAECGGELVVQGEKAKARNPYLLVYFKAIEAKRAAMRELGFTPSARVGLPIDDNGAPDPGDGRWQQLLALAERGKAEPALFIERSKRHKGNVAAEDTAPIENPPGSSQPQ
jgi:phage terminase small subunit